MADEWTLSMQVSYGLCSTSVEGKCKDADWDECTPIVWLHLYPTSSEGFLPQTDKACYRPSI